MRIFLMACILWLFMVSPLVEQEYVPQDEPKAYREVLVEVTAYTVGDDHTPSSIMANGETPYEGACAFNNVELGTKLMIDDKLYVVLDRALEDNNVDIYRDSIDECYEIGRKAKVIKIMDGDL